MDEELFIRAKAFAEKHGATLGKELGFGIHGSVILLRRQGQAGLTALKICHERGPYLRECDAYDRLAQAEIFDIHGFAVPELFSRDDTLLAFEMTFVTPPFVLDFASAYLDFPPKFSDEVWADWTKIHEEAFGPDWPMAQQILSSLEDIGIFMTDPSPSNIRFRF